MLNEEVRVQDALQRVNIFGEKHAADFAASTPGAKQFATIATAATATKNLGADQASGKGQAREGAFGKAAWRHLLHDDLAHINRSAHSLALQGVTGLDAKFRMPRSNGDQALLTAARAFATDALPLKQQFLDVAMEADFLDTLKAHTDGFEAASKTKAAGAGKQAGATGGLAQTMHAAVLALHILDPIVRNKYRNNAVVLGEWTTASHVESAPKKTKKPTAPPAPTA